MTTRKIRGHIERPDGSVWSGGIVTFKLNLGSFTPKTQYPSAIIQRVTDAGGNFDVDLWANAEGETGSNYTAILPDGRKFNFVVPTGSGDLSMSFLREAGATEPEPRYETLAAYIDERIADLVVNYDGHRDIFTLTNATAYNLAHPLTLPAQSTRLFINGLKQQYGVDYTINGQVLNLLINYSGLIGEIYY